MGGLGNQLFQWAYAYSLSNFYNTNFYLDKHSYSFDKLRIYELNKFPNIQTGLTDFELSKHLLPNTREEIDDFNFKYRFLTSGTNLYLNGYWQSEKYFKEYRSAILTMLSATKEKYQEFSKIIKTNSVSIHIRRTDYLTSNGYHPVQPKEYFDKALQYINNYEKIYVFSDDIEWCINNLKYPNIEFINGYDNIDDLWMMSMCSHNIISNSTFSWWGAWLNPNQNKIVIAPNNWFGLQANLNTSDIIPKEWVKI